MKRTIICLILALAAFGCADSKNDPVTFYVAPYGNDSHSGLFEECQCNTTDGPFLTLARARDAVRELKRDKGLPLGGVTVTIRGGVYQMTETLELTAEDSGNKESAIMWRAYPNEKPVLMGGVYANSFKTVTSNAILERIEEQYRKNIVSVDLAELGISDPGSVNPSSGKRIELYFKGKFMTVARYPNEAWLTIADVPQTGPEMINKGLERDKSAVPRGRHYGRFSYPDDRPKSWKDTGNLWIHGFWTWDWADEYMKVAAVDTQKREITPVAPHHRYGYTKGQRFYFLNVLEELDSPGEWYIDTKQNMLYFWPPSEIKENDCVISTLETAMISLDSVSDLTIQGLAFEGSRGNAIIMESCNNVSAEGCAFRNLGQTAVLINGGSNNGVRSSDIYDTAGGGVFIDGGDRLTLTPAGNYAENNHIHHFAHRIKTYQAAVQITGVGNRASHNLIHDSPHTGIFLATSRVGNDHIIEYNELHSLALETGDVGAIYICGRDFTMRGNVVRYNYIHHVQGPGHHGAMAIYLDDFTSGTEVYGNICWKASRNILIGGGRDNVIRNNIFVEGDPAVHVDARGIGWASYYFNEQSKFLGLMEAVNYDQPPYSERYPELLTVQDDQPALAKYNVIERNISTGGRWLDLRDGLDFDIVAVKNNIIADKVLGSWNNASGKNENYNAGNTAIEQLLKDNDNIVLGPDSKIVDPENKLFNPAPGSPAEDAGFEPIPVEKIGLYQDELRLLIPR